MIKSILLFLFLSNLLFAQNLVPNPSFEDVNCPIQYTGFPNQIDQYLNGWRSGNCASPDIYAPCSQDSITRPPAAWYGSQNARTGTNFAAFGFYEIGPISWYEYLVCELVQPLAAGQTYDLSYWLSRADSTRYASNAMGAAFASTLDTCVSGFEGPVLPHSSVFSPGNFITDTIGWTQISTQYTATGSERYLVLGCFEPWAELQLQDFGSGQNRCYYYVDDVELKLASTNSITEDLFIQKPAPNPFQNEFSLTTKLPSTLTVFDVFGKKLFEKKLGLNQHHRIDMADFVSGTYLVELEANNRKARSVLVKN
jgi:hypothetical protein